MPILGEFQAALAGTEVHRDAAARRLRELMSEDPNGFRSLALGHLGQMERVPGIQVLLRVLHQGGMLVDVLVNSRAMPIELALRVIEISGGVIEDLDVLLAKKAVTGTAEQTRRAVRMLSRMPTSGRILTPLARGLHSSDIRVRASIAGLLAKACQDPALARHLLNDPDSRVRANAIEALWESNHPTARAVFEASLRDPDNRVATNGALGLLKLGDSRGANTLHLFITSASRRHCLSAIWAMEQAGDPGFLPALEKLMRESKVSSVRQRAAVAVSRLRQVQVEQSLADSEETSSESEV